MEEDELLGGKGGKDSSLGLNKKEINKKYLSSSQKLSNAEGEGQGVGGAKTGAFALWLKSDLSVFS